MHTNHRIAFAIVLVSSFCSALPLSGQPGDKPTLADQRKRLAEVHTGMSAEQVLKKLGKPDEVRRAPNIGKTDPMIDQWAYGIVAKGMFARVGIVSLSRDGKVVATKSADVFSGSAASRELVPTKNDQVVSTTSKMSCHVGSAQYVPPRDIEVKGIGTITAHEGLEVTVTLKNAGTKAFALKHGAASRIKNLLLVELYDADGTLLFREDNLRHLSTFSFYPEKWPVLSVPAGEEKSEALVFSPDKEFGPLPAGKYSVRVYFPFEERKYYPSNLVRFEWKEREKK